MADVVRPMDTASDSGAMASSSVSTKPTVIIVIGMAGSGKTTLIQRLNSHLYETSTPSYLINLDPAVTHVPYSPNVDIRDTVKYKEVMKQYNLGPNGGILTSCNLFATRFDQVITMCERPRDPPLKYILLDTPGQIEIFTWSASGAIVTELLASSFPTVIVFVIDTPRCASPSTFMSNMLQAVSILYKTRLPLLLVFNKIDVVRHEFATEWMSDFERFQEALDSAATAVGGGNYASTLARSLCLVLDEFYAGIAHVGVSAMTGEGVKEFFTAIDACAEQYSREYLPELEARRRQRDEKEAARKEREMNKLREGMAQASIQPPAGAPKQEGLQQGAQPPPKMDEEDATSGSCDYEVSDDEIECD